MKKFRKILSVALAVCMLASMSTSVMAESVEEKTTTQNYNVSYDKPNEANERGTSKPREIHDVSQSGTYNFHGEAYTQDLYTDYLLIGKSSYNIKVKNLGSEELTVKVYINQFGFDKKLILLQFLQTLQNIVLLVG